jgi:hypothetical protein
MITLCNGDEEQIDLNKLRQLYMLMTSSRRRHKPDIGHKPTTDAIWVLQQFRYMYKYTIHVLNYT